MNRQIYVVVPLLVVLMAIPANGQTRLFLVPHGMNPTATTPGVPVNVEVVGRTTLDLDVYVEVRGGSRSVTGVQFELPCQVSAGSGDPLVYVPASVTANGSSLLGCTANWFDQAGSGNCPADKPGGLAATPLGSHCLLAAPVLIGALSYEVPAAIPVPNLYLVRPTIAILADANQLPIAGLQVDGVDATICATCPPVPAVSDWGMLVLFLATICAASIVLRRRQVFGVHQVLAEQRHRPQNVRSMHRDPNAGL